MTVTTQHWRAARIAAVGISLVSGCALFGLGEIYCHSDENCPSGSTCDEEGVCQGDRPWTPPWISADAGVDGDGGSSSDCMTTRCNAMPDSATSYCSDGEAQPVECASIDSRFYGQDGNYLSPIPEYRSITDAVAQDLITGLFWEKIPDAEPRSFHDAEQYCAALGLAELGWRTPSYRELMSLIDYGRGATGGQAAMDPGYFPGAVGKVWSSTVAYADSRWGFDDHGFPDSLSITDTHAVRCVSGEIATSRALVEQDGGWLDPGTGLVWRQQSDGPLGWQAALMHCVELSAGAQEDWRLPSVKELETTVDRTLDDTPLIRAPLQRSCASDHGCLYWSSTPVHSSESVWYLDFDRGDVSTATSGSQHLVRCVRGPI